MKKHIYKMCIKLLFHCLNLNNSPLSSNCYWQVNNVIYLLTSNSVSDQRHWGS